MSLPHGRHHRRQSSDTTDPLSHPDIYYGDERHLGNQPRRRRQRAFSSNLHQLNLKDIDQHIGRRSSHDVQTRPRKFTVNVDATLNALLEREDTDNNMQITIEDEGLKVLSVGTSASSGFNKSDLRGTYMLSNLLQELTIAKSYGRTWVDLDESRLNENPVDRLERSICTTFWNALTRHIDGSNIDVVARDPKDWNADPQPRIYVPHGVPQQYEYYKNIADSRPELRLDVQTLPEGPITPEYVRDLNDKPGLLALAMEEYTDYDTGKTDLRGVPFVVPGGRFNELYGWDSYMESLGLIASDRVDLAKSMVVNFCFCIKHYGKILNANRTYYLLRSQPPFLTDMALRVYDCIKGEPGSLEFLKEAILAAIKEYHSVWMAAPRLDPVTNLSRYRPSGLGVPPETEATHFYHLLQPYADKHGLSFEKFVRAYNHGEVECPELDEYFLHDRAVRESGHDTSYRLEAVCADLATVDLNSLLYRYETDIARTIRQYFKDKLPIPPEFRTWQNEDRGFETSATWDRRATRRRRLMDKYMWNDEKGMYFDYDTAKGQMTDYESATTFWTMWAGVTSPERASVLVRKSLPKFQAYGGLVSGTKESRGEIGLDRPSRQWDYPYGWAPQQMLAWTALERFGYHDEAEALAYRWLYMITKAFIDFNGVVVEKYDVTRPIDPHRVDAEYGNQGLDFKGVSREGFGWVNASFVFGLQFLNAHMRRALGACIPYDSFSKATALDGSF